MRMAFGGGKPSDPPRDEIPLTGRKYRQGAKERERVGMSAVVLVGER
jgi:hypothetical protein